MKLYIKHMVCSRCILAIESILLKTGLTPISIELGVVELEETSIDSKKSELINELQLLGFELLDDKTSKTIEKIKTSIIDLVHRQNNQIKETLSEYISSKLHHDYSALSNLFSSVEGITIEKYYILQKVERVKELLVYDEMSIGEIAELLQYSSTAYLSNQFKKTTGLSPSHFKKMKINRRISLEDL